MSVVPTIPRTSSGTALPIASLPQDALLTVSDKEVPLLKDALGDGVSFQPLRVDLENNTWVVIATFAPGVVMPIHYHTGSAEVYTLAGRWHYVEYPDQPQTTGSYLYEPGGSVHTLCVPESNTEDTVAFIRVEGANVNFNEDGSFHSILDAVLLEAITHDLAAAQGVAPVRYLRGNEHTYSGS